MNEPFRLHLEFSSLADFAAFIQLVRGGDLDETKLAEVTAKLRKSTKVLLDTEKKASAT
jgi:hypothetical protein